MIIEGYMGYWGYPNMVWTGMNMILPVGQSQLQRSAARLAPCVQHGTSILELCQCSSELSTHCQWKHSKCTKVHWSWYALIWFMSIYIYILYIIYNLYIYIYNNLAKFNCTVSLCVLILLPRIRADLSETQTRSKGANRRSVHRPWPCQASASTSLCQNRNRREMSHHTPTRDSFTRVCRGWDGYGWIYVMYRYVMSVHCKKMAKQSSAFDLAANAVQPTQQNWQNTNCTPGGSLQGDKCLVLGLGGTPAVRTTCRHQSKSLQSSQRRRNWT